MKTLIISVLSWLLHHANRNIDYSNKKYFYPIKNKILTKYGKHIKYDVQFIEGKRCFSCARKDKPNKPRIYEPNMDELNTRELPF